ncbi:DUF6286 domain-containing protein [Streptantibioticus silvisoli]|uniref:DUF6286 domain-containing protein n=1 Tax=Streptantibioticus silvisoli TaxID=2705255 RepID=A0ABT6W062_9ACTN|nr:DUF6286 domain-containing protein [Streptantibioticus silvisoli]MDI5963093.1 DUF6286 domain-containing protein [Streptantibioticus silvisoli]
MTDPGAEPPGTARPPGGSGTSGVSGPASGAGSGTSGTASGPASGTSGSGAHRAADPRDRGGDAGTGDPGHRDLDPGDPAERDRTTGGGDDPAGAGPVPPLNARVPEEHAEPGPRPGGRGKRFWSPRRLPALITALLVLAGSGLLLYDVAAVRAGRRAMAWRVRVARELATRPLDDTWVLAGAALAAALGLWLLVLAATPGLRQVLAMRPGPGRIRAGLDRDAAALVLRDRALEVPGVQSVRVAVGRRRAKVRAESHFRALDDVRDDLDSVLGDARRGLGLQRPPRLSLAVRRAGKG